MLSVRLGRAARRRRESLGMSKTETSHRAGIARNTLRSIERGDTRRRPPAVLERLAHTLGVHDLRELAAAEILEPTPRPCHSTWPPDAPDELDLEALDPVFDAQEVDLDAQEPELDDQDPTLYAHEVGPNDVCECPCPRWPHCVCGVSDLDLEER